MQKRRETACIKIREFPYFCSKKPGERNADKAPLSGTVRHAMHLQFSITSRYDVRYHVKRLWPITFVL